MHFDTLSVHAGHLEDQIGSIMSPIHVTTTFERDEAGNIGGKDIYIPVGTIPTGMDWKLKLASAGRRRRSFCLPLRDGGSHGPCTNCTGARYTYYYPG